MTCPSRSRVSEIARSSRAHAGVVDEHQHAAEALLERVEQALELLRRGHVGAHRQRASAAVLRCAATVAPAASSLGRKLTPTAQPSAASAHAIAEPMPREAPVTSAQPARSLAAVTSHPTS